MELSVLAFIDDENAKGCKSAGKSIFQVEGLAKAEARGDGSHNGYQRIVYGNLPHGIQAEQLVVEREAYGRDGNEQQQTGDAKHINVG